MPTPLARKIKDLIVTDGPISVADFFSICLADPQYGYYQVREPFGRSGDFVTAPEISQLFGEIIGVFLVHAWQGHGAPDSVRLVEIGPGRGTLMADALRTIERLSPDFYASIGISLVETSERLRQTQRQTLMRHKQRIDWHDDFASVPSGFTLLIANEFFDAIPIRQFVKCDGHFHERVVALNDAGELIFGLGPLRLEASLLPSDAERAPPGAVAEVSPPRTAIMLSIAERLRQQGGSALIIDYGHTSSNFGDTLQAVRNHAFDPPLAHPGEADLTSHVDFEALAMAALAAGAHVHRPLAQGDFLLGLGLLERAGALGANKDSLTRATITEAVNRLAGEGPGSMGELFKVLCISGQPLALLPFDPQVAPPPPPPAN
ncbi:class I SAM-dependent methyltransferase [Pseudohoeflea coraliihabitans]|uniref:Class I SAM-dependent methyltransferase n=1 Tax=Pseudohoeflea coraliihabitans TaxID=2860393 RepID=A0ABS6WJH6_9HYPH|nr:class I SAM-dependent methyltransferase [Pseudohoeflea sp. DP4N28-3]MBW3096099.1 class I SAM-dependent methyltransferase [Pseudohoeflea sp. DP4N28-3]